MPKKKVKTNATSEEVALKGIAYVNTKDQIKTLEGECKELRKPLEAFLDEFGRTTESGSILAVVTHGDKDVCLHKTLRTGKTLLPEAQSILESNGFKECVEMVPTVREDVIERLYEEGKIPDSLLQQIYQEKSSFAFSVDLKPHYDEADI